MNITLKPSKLNGKLKLITSKSFAHRAIICACIANGKSKIHDVNMCDDIKNTINALREIFDINIKNNDLEINGGIKKFNKTNFQINESATTLRLLFPLLSYYSKEKITFEVGDRLFERGISEYEKLYQNKNETIKKEDNKIIVDSFPIENFYSISSEVSSQFASGLIILAATLKQDTTINIKNYKNSLSYVDLTIEMLNRFGANIKRVGSNVFVIHNQKLESKEITMPSDSTFMINCLVMNKLGSNIEFIKSIFDKYDPDYNLYKKISEVDYLPNSLDMSNNPDSLIPLVVLATKNITPVTFENVARLKLKESNRIDVLLDIINSMGGKAELINNKDLIVYPSKLKSINYSSFNDHRFSLFFIILSTILDQNISIYDFEAINKSYPNLLNDFSSLGLKYQTNNDFDELSYSFENKETKIVLGNNSINELKKYKNTKSKKIIFIDQNIPNEYVNRLTQILGDNILKYEFSKNGESVKKLNQFESIIRFLLENEVSKTDIIFALGGGSVLDLISFVSSVYKRGINFVSIPTTLLSMIDASIGGKNGIDLDEYKNMIGSFNNPDTIIVDYDLLNYLPKEEIKSGMAEIIKIAALSSSNLFFDIFDLEPYSNLKKWIKEAIKLKISFVEKDPYDENIRHALNFGHTSAHAIEIKNKLRHGEAVAIGMMIESNNETIKQCLYKYGFKNIYYNNNNDINNDIIKNDKKIEYNEITLVDVFEIGTYKFKKVRL